VLDGGWGALDAWLAPPVLFLLLQVLAKMGCTASKADGGVLGERRVDMRQYEFVMVSREGPGLLGTTAARMHSGVAPC
jgi:hypothetical protein